MYKLEEIMSDVNLSEKFVIVINNTESRDPVASIPLREYCQRLARARNKAGRTRSNFFVTKQVNFTYHAWKNDYLNTPTKATVDYLNSICQWR